MGHLVAYILLHEREPRQLDNHLYIYVGVAGAALLPAALSACCPSCAPHCIPSLIGQILRDRCCAGHTTVAPDLQHFPHVMEWHHPFGILTVIFCLRFSPAFPTAGDTGV